MEHHEKKQGSEWLSALHSRLQNYNQNQHSSMPAPAMMYRTSIELSRVNIKRYCESKKEEGPCIGLSLFPESSIFYYFLKNVILNWLKKIMWSFWKMTVGKYCLLQEMMRFFSLLQYFFYIFSIVTYLLFWFYL